MENGPKVVLALIPKKGKILVIDRVVHAMKVSWAFPGGVIESGESAEIAAKREAKEEVGVDVEPIKEISRRKHPNTLIDLAYIECRMSDPDQQPQILQPDEINEIRWVTGEEALGLFTSDVDPFVKNFLETLH